MLFFISVIFAQPFKMYNTSQQFFEVNWERVRCCTGQLQLDVTGPCSKYTVKSLGLACLSSSCHEKIPSIRRLRSQKSISHNSGAGNPELGCQKGWFLLRDVSLAWDGSLVIVQLHDLSHVYACKSEGRERFLSSLFSKVISRGSHPHYLVTRITSERCHFQISSHKNLGSIYTFSL